MKLYSSNYFLRILKGDYHPFTPFSISLGENSVEVSRRNWHLISKDSKSLHFQNITGVSVDKHVFGATLVIKSSGNDDIVVWGLWKMAASEVKKYCHERISSNSQRGAAAEMASVLKGVVANGGAKVQSTYSVADELRKLKDLKDEGVLSEEEFEQQKAKVLGR